jgi:hypothetical protein
VEHALPQVEQLAGLVVVSTQEPLQAVGALGGQLEVHEYVPSTAAHTIELGQALPQDPQFETVVPSMHAPLHGIIPAPHTSASPPLSAPPSRSPSPAPGPSSVSPSDPSGSCPPSPGGDVVASQFLPHSEDEYWFKPERAAHAAPKPHMRAARPPKTKNRLTLTSVRSFGHQGNYKRRNFHCILRHIT